MELIPYNQIPNDIKEKMCLANVFFSEKYNNFVLLKNEQMLYAYDYERIIPIRLRKKYFFKWAVFVSEPYNIVDSPLKSLESFLDSAVDLISKNGAGWIISTASCDFKDTPSYCTLRIPFGNHIINLEKDEEEIWNNIHSKHKNVIRKAIKENVLIKKGGIELLDDYLIIDNETWDRSNSKSPGKNYYKCQIESLDENCVIYIAYLDAKPQAGAIFFYNKNICYYMYGCSLSKCSTGSANYLMWSAILDMKNSYVKRFSFVGCRINEDENSKYHGIQRFKERFGGKLEEGFLFRTVINKFYYKAFCFAMSIKNKRKYKDAIDEEIFKWKDIQK